MTGVLAARVDDNDETANIRRPEYHRLGAFAVRGGIVAVAVDGDGTTKI